MLALVVQLFNEQNARMKRLEASAVATRRGRESRIWRGVDRSVAGFFGGHQLGASGPPTGSLLKFRTMHTYRYIYIYIYVDQNWGGGSPALLTPSFPPNNGLVRTIIPAFQDPAVGLWWFRVGLGSFFFFLGGGVSLFGFLREGLRRLVCRGRPEFFLGRAGVVGTCFWWGLAGLSMFVVPLLEKQTPFLP